MGFWLKKVLVEQLYVPAAERPTSPPFSHELHVYKEVPAVLIALHDSQYRAAHYIKHGGWYQVCLCPELHVVLIFCFLFPNNSLYPHCLSVIPLQFLVTQWRNFLKLRQHLILGSFNVRFLE